MKRVFIFLLIVIPLVSQSQTTCVLNPGEQIEYKVKWSIFTIGSIKLTVSEPFLLNGKTCFKIRQEMRSNPTLFFINMNSVHESIVYEDLRPHYFSVSSLEDSTDYSAHYNFDYHKNEIYADINWSDKNTLDTLDLQLKHFDGLGVVFYTRQNCLSNRNDTIWTIAKNYSGKVVLHFEEEREEFDSDCLQKEIQAVKVSGNFLIEGIAGLSGPFETWISDDQYRIPIKSKMKVFLGSIVLNLVNYKKGQYSHNKPAIVKQKSQADSVFTSSVFPSSQ